MTIEEKHSHHCERQDHARAHTHKACVSLVPIFNHLSDEQLDEIMVTTQSTSFKKGEMIYHAGEESNALYIVNQGKIRIYRLAESGKEQLVRILNPGDFTGEMALFNETTHESYAEAMVATKVCRIRREDLQSFLVKYPTISLKILQELSSRIDETEKQATRFSTESVETRIASFLAECLDAEASGRSFTLPMSKKDLASYLGTTPETISRKLGDLEDKGLIRQKPKKKIEVLDLDGLLLV
ncbi:Crp/Fnr family transcriptional regulator [Pisciglobus halotolerans]|uniref:CRP/FNR family transcriptional regulator, anaerobic regulatory protein n=1 Tax=Pisciglobus halotolerans TaxID=745365 RepID=A0A1I3APD8_9LACT|nr:Crp/Fnr family transcriptional regulator [Pisciglobus halotolerans]SFH51914.1 CRP/FNR family transcriptional regulator, anaerobic regulatory protein [Pisciglobus halotolerans]